MSVSAELSFRSLCLMIMLILDGLLKDIFKDKHMFVKMADRS